MTKSEAPVESKSPPQNTVQRQPETPERNVERSRDTQISRSALPPPDGLPPEAKAGGLVSRADMGTPVRARMTTAMQRSVGNARVGELTAPVMRLNHPDTASAADPQKRDRPLVQTPLVQTPLVQTQLVVNTPGDAHEQEADQVANQVGHARPAAPVASISRLANGAAPVRRVEGEDPGHAGMTPDLEGRIQSPSAGRPLEPAMRRDMETGLGTSLAHVRVHDSQTDRTDADQLNAKAFTHGSHIWIGSAGAPDDRKLMAHELTHVVQQTGGVQREPADDVEASEAGPAGDEVEAPAPDTAVDSAGAAAPEEETQQKVEPAAAVPEPSETPEPAPAEDQSTAAPSAPAAPTPEATPHKAAPAPTEAAPVPSQKAPAVTAAPQAPDIAPAPAGAAPAPAHAPSPEAAAAPQAPDISPTPTPAAPAPSQEAAGVTAAPQAPDIALAPEPAASLAPANAAAPEPAAPSPAPAPPDLVQRDDDDDTGILSGIRRRFRSVVDSLSSGWTSLTGMARSAYDSVRDAVGGLVTTLTSFVNSAIASLQSAWQSIAARVTVIVRTVQQLISGLLSPIFAAGQTIVGFVKRLDPLGLAGAWARLTGLIATVQQRVQQALDGALRTITGLWGSISATFTNLLGSLTTRARELLGRAQQAGQSVGQRLSSAWTALQGRASQMSGALGGIARRLMSLLDSLLSWGRGIWEGIQRGWSSLTASLSALMRSIGERFSTALQSLRGQATSLWTRLGALWIRLKTWASALVQRLLNGIRSIINSIRNISFAGFLRKIFSLATFFRLAQEFVTNIREYLAPTAGKITDRVFAGMPGRALSYGQEQLAKVGASNVATPAVAGQDNQGGPETAVQRQPGERSTAGIEEVADGYLKAIKTMWENMTWSAFFHMILDMLIEQLVPLVAVYRQGKAFITQDWPALVDSLYKPRNLFTDPLGFLHDIYTNLLHLITGLLLAALRRLINILMAFMLWVTIILTVIGAVGGSVAVGILGAIAGAVFGMGVGAGPGGAAGAAAGGAAGAGVGFGVALAVGEALFFLYLGIHGATILLTLLQLFTGRQTDAEKKRDYAQIAESSVAAGVGLLLLFLAWLAGVVAEGVASLLKNIKTEIQLPPALSRFLRGIKATRKPGAKEPSIADQTRQLVIDQLSTEIGRDLAINLVDELGAEAAGVLVRQLGPENVRTLATELGPLAIQRVSNALARDAVTRLLGGGLRPGAIDFAVAAGQADRLAALSVEQIGRFAGLSQSGFRRIITLPEPQFLRFSSLPSPQLGAFADMDAAAFARIAALDDAHFAPFRTMPPAKIQVFAGLTPAQFNRFTALPAADFARFAALTPEAIGRFAGLGDAAFARFAALPADVLAKFVDLDAAALARFGNMGAARFAVFSQAGKAAIEKFATLTDPAFARLSGIGNLTVADLDKLGGLDRVALENLATVTADANIIFLTRAVNAAALTNVLQLSGPEIDSMLARVGTNPPRINTLGTLPPPELRTFLAVADNNLLQRFASLTTAELNAFRGLATAELDQFVQTPLANLRKFAGAGNAAIRRFVALTPAQIANFGTLTSAQVATWGNAQAPTLARFAATDALTLGKLADGAGTAGVDRLAALPAAFVDQISLLTPAAMRRYMALPPADLAKFDGMSAFNMEQLAGRPPGELENLAATRTPAQLLADAGEDIAANRTAVGALDDPTINPITNEPRGHASEHAADSANVPLGGISPVEGRLRTGTPITPGRAIKIPPPQVVSVFASDAAQLQANRLAVAQLQAEINAGNPLGPAADRFRKTIILPMEGAGFSFTIQGGAPDPITGHIVGGTMVRRQVGSFRVVFEPRTVPPPVVPTSPVDYFIVTMFPE